MNPTTRTHAALTKLFAAAALLVSLLFAPAAASAQQTSAQEESASEPETISIDFNGGNLEDYAELLQKSGAQINVIINRDAAKTSLPPIKLSGVTPVSAIELLRAINPTLALNSDRGIYVISKQIDRSVVPTASYAKAISIREILTDRKKEDVLNAIEFGLEMVEGEPNSMRLQLHEETSLLFIKGNEQQIEIVQNVLKELGPPSMQARNQQQMMQQMMKGLGGRYTQGQRSPEPSQSNRNPRQNQNNAPLSNRRPSQTVPSSPSQSRPNQNNRPFSNSQPNSNPFQNQTPPKKNSGSSGNNR